MFECFQSALKNAKKNAVSIRTPATASANNGTADEAGSNTSTNGTAVMKSVSEEFQALLNSVRSAAYGVSQVTDATNGEGEEDNSNLESVVAEEDLLIKRQTSAQLSSNAVKKDAAVSITTNSRRSGRKVVVEENVKENVKTEASSRSSNRREVSSSKKGAVSSSVSKKPLGTSKSISNQSASRADSRKQKIIEEAEEDEANYSDEEEALF